MNGEYHVAAPQSKVWAALNNPEILQQAVPGCTLMQKTSDTTFKAQVTAKVGPVKANFTGEVAITNIDPPNSYTISGEGKGGAAGFAKGGATVTLEKDGTGTLLKYSVHANVGGKLAQIGSRLIDATAKKMANTFFSQFSEIISTAQNAIDTGSDPKTHETSDYPSKSTHADPTTGLSPFVWVGGLVTITFFILLAFSMWPIN